MNSAKDYLSYMYCVCGCVSVYVCGVYAFVSWKKQHRIRANKQNIVRFRAATVLSV